MTGCCPSIRVNTIGRMRKKGKPFVFKRALKQFLSLPTAPFCEEAVTEAVLAGLKRIGVGYRIDRHGNIIAHMRRGRKKITPMALVAHMDHPGFVAMCQTGSFVTARILGGVGADLKGRRIRFFGKKETVGEIAGIEIRDSNGNPTFLRVRVDGDTPGGSLGMWDIPVFRRQGRKIHARAIDDVCGVVVMLEVLNRIRQRKSGNIDLYCCFTRAEEVGFVGAAALAGGRLLPRHALIISIEMSKELPGRSEQGKGFVVRVGDKATIFEPRIIGFMIDHARRMQSVRRTFRFQTAILDGGTCEATLFNAMGYRSAGVALPLGNYHNRTPDSGVAPEYIDERDLNGLIEFLAELPGQMGQWGTRERMLRARLEKNFRKWKVCL